MSKIKVEKFRTYVSVMVRSTQDNFFHPESNSRGVGLEYTFDTDSGLMRVYDKRNDSCFYIPQTNISQFWVADTSKEEVAEKSAPKAKLKPAKADSADA
jgi:hypothetical protein